MKMEASRFSETLVSYYNHYTVSSRHENSCVGAFKCVRYFYVSVCSYCSCRPCFDV